MTSHLNKEAFNCCANTQEKIMWETGRLPDARTLSRNINLKQVNSSVHEMGWWSGDFLYLILRIDWKHERASDPMIE